MDMITQNILEEKTVIKTKPNRIRLAKNPKVFLSLLITLFISCEPFEKVKPLNVFILLDQTLSVDSLDLDDYPKILNAVFNQLNPEIGDRVAVGFIQENSLDQREIRFQHSNQQSGLDVATKKKNAKAVQEFSNQVRDAVKFARHSRYTDVYGGLSLAATYFSSIPDTSIIPVLLVVSDGLHNNPVSSRQIVPALSGAHVYWAGLDNKRFAALSKEYKNALKGSQAMVQILLGRSGIPSLMDGDIQFKRNVGEKNG